MVLECRGSVRDIGTLHDDGTEVLTRIVPVSSVLEDGNDTSSPASRDLPGSGELRVDNVRRCLDRDSSSPRPPGRGSSRLLIRPGADRSRVPRTRSPRGRHLRPPDRRPIDGERGGDRRSRSKRSVTLIRANSGGSGKYVIIEDTFFGEMIDRLNLFALYDF